MKVSQALYIVHNTSCEKMDGSKETLCFADLLKTCAYQVIIKTSQCDSATISAQATVYIDFKDNEINATTRADPECCKNIRKYYSQICDSPRSRNRLLLFLELLQLYLYAAFQELLFAFTRQPGYQMLVSSSWLAPSSAALRK